MKLSFTAAILFIYAGSLCYVSAAYYHLSLKEGWSFCRALLIALPLVIIEYCFSLPGNRALHEHHGVAPSQILIMTMIFYFVNLWLLNVAVLGKRVKNAYIEGAALLLVLVAFYITSAIE
jgi:uncharacterized protein (DUF486 family)